MTPGQMRALYDQQCVKESTDRSMPLVDRTSEQFTMGDGIELCVETNTLSAVIGMVNGSGWSGL